MTEQARRNSEIAKERQQHADYLQDEITKSQAKITELEEKLSSVEKQLRLASATVGAGPVERQKQEGISWSQMAAAVEHAEFDNQ